MCWQIARDLFLNGCDRPWFSAAVGGESQAARCCFAVSHTAVRYRANAVIMVGGKLGFRVKLGTAKSQSYVNKSSHFAYEVYLRIVLLKI